MAWLAFVALGIVVGWGLKPRMDEIAFMLVVPVAIVIPYAAFCLVAVFVRSLLSSIRSENGRWIGLASLKSSRRIGRRP